MNTKMLSILGVITVVIIGGLVFASQSNVSAPTKINSTNTTNTTNTTSTQVQPTSASGTDQKTYTLADVSSHNNQSSCWTAVNGKVYDVTSFISRHEGGEDKILSLCGIDGTSAFTNQHGSQRKPNNELAKFYIGDLK